MHADRCGNTGRQKCCAKGSGKEVKIQEFMYRDTTNVEPEMYDWNSNEKLKEKYGNCTRKTFDRFTTKDSYTWNSTHNTESTAVRSLKRERWGSPLVQEKYREEKACDKRHPYPIIIIIIIKYWSVKLEAWAVGITAGSREVPGRKGLWQETSISYNNNNNNNFHYSGSHNVKMQKVCRGKCIARKTYNNHWIAVTIYTLQNFFSGVQL